MKKNKIAQMSAALRHANKKSRAMIFKKMAIIKIFFGLPWKSADFTKKQRFFKKNRRLPWKTALETNRLKGF